MQLETLESRMFLSGDGNTVTVPIHDSVSGNLFANFAEGKGSLLGKFTAAFNAQGVFVFTAANGDELWALPTVLGPTADPNDDPNLWHAEGNIIGGTGRFTDASGTFSHDVLFTDDQGDFIFTNETMITLPRPWNNHGPG